VGAFQHRLAVGTRVAKAHRVDHALQGLGGRCINRFFGARRRRRRGRGRGRRVEQIKGELAQAEHGLPS
jgi:hypothetical protein